MRSAKWRERLKAGRSEQNLNGPRAFWQILNVGIMFSGIFLAHFQQHLLSKQHLAIWIKDAFVQEMISRQVMVELASKTGRIHLTPSHAP
jgi:hypothetical protein